MRRSLLRSRSLPARAAQYVRRPPVHAPDARGLDRSELGVFLFAAEQYDRDHAALAVLLGLNGLRVSEACATNVGDLGVERGHRTLRAASGALHANAEGWTDRPAHREVGTGGQLLGVGNDIGGPARPGEVLPVIARSTGQGVDQEEPVRHGQ